MCQLQSTRLGARVAGPHSDVSLQTLLSTLTTASRVVPKWPTREPSTASVQLVPLAASRRRHAALAPLKVAVRGPRRS